MVFDELFCVFVVFGISILKNSLIRVRVFVMVLVWFHQKGIIHQYLIQSLLLLRKHFYPTWENLNQTFVNFANKILFFISKWFTSYLLLISSIILIQLKICLIFSGNKVNDIIQKGISGLNSIPELRKVINLYDMMHIHICKNYTFLAKLFV